MANCCVPGCIKAKRNPSVSFHSFPRDSMTRIEWANANGIPTSVLREWSAVCSMHFASTDFERDLRAELTGRHDLA